MAPRFIDRVGPNIKRLRTALRSQHAAVLRQEFIAVPLDRARRYSDPVGRRAWIVFAIWQFLGIVCGAVAWGPLPFAVGFIGLLPGNILAALTVERALWQTRLSLMQISLIEIPVVLLTNAFVWLSLAFALRAALKAAKRFRPPIAPRQIKEGQQRAVFPLRRIPAWMWSMAIVGIAIIGVATMWRRPVLVHLFSEWGCACGDYHARVSGIVIRNPLRDRQPERVADDFLDGLKVNRCWANAELCDYALPRHRVSDWRLVNREDGKDSVRLYFRLTKYGTSNAGYDLTGEGMVQVEKSNGTWRVAFYSSYF